MVTLLVLELVVGLEGFVISVETWSLRLHILILARSEALLLAVRSHPCAITRVLFEVVGQVHWIEVVSLLVGLFDLAGAIRMW